MEDRQNPNLANTIPSATREGGGDLSGRSPKRRRARTSPGSRVAQVFDTIESAAAKLGLDENALRARCRRAAERVHDATVARLGGGIVAFKFGKSWRVRFPAT
jgi:hypothetical protein